MAATHGVQWADFRIPPINLWVMPLLSTSRDDKSAGLHDLVAGLLAERRRAAGRGRDAEAQRRSNSTYEMNQIRQLHRQLLAIRGGNHGNEN